MTLPKLTDYSTFEDETLPFADTGSDSSDDAEKATATEGKGGKKGSLAVWIQVTVILILLVCVLCGAFSAAAVQVLDGAIPEFELNAWRFFIQWLMVVPVVLYKRTPIRTAVRNIPILGLSIFLVNVLNVVMYTTYIYLPLGLADGLMNAVVLSGNALLSLCIKDDRKCALYIGAGMCVIGFVLMMQPGFMFAGAGLPPPPVTNWTSSCKNNLTAGHSHDPSDPMGYVYAILSALVLIGSFHAIGKMVEVLDPFTFSFWNGILGTGNTSMACTNGNMLQKCYNAPIFPKMRLYTLKFEVVPAFI
jgi:drug/metabolite transporter (DMT)-like permease